MSNDELVLKIKGGAVEYKNQLWEQIKRLVYVICRRCMVFYSSGQYDEDEIINTAWLGVERAICDYNPEKGFKFNSYLGYHIRNTVKEYLGVRGKNDPLNGYTSLDDTVKGKGEETEDLTLVDTLEDERAVQALENVEERASGKWIWSEVDKLNERQKCVICGIYKHNKTLNEVGQDIGISGERVRTLRRNALKSLRKNTALHEYFADFYGFRHIGARTFNNTWTSSTEYAAMKLIDRNQTEYERHTSEYERFYNEVMRRHEQTKAELKLQNRSKQKQKIKKVDILN